MATFDDLWRRKRIARLFGPANRRCDWRQPDDDGESVRSREIIEIYPSYRLVDTCAAEFEAYTPYYYSTYDNQSMKSATATRRRS